MSTSRLRTFGTRTAGPGNPVYITGAIGLTHNGDLDNAIALTDAAAEAGCAAVNFHQRTPELSTPPAQSGRSAWAPGRAQPASPHEHRSSPPTAPSQVPGNTSQ